MYVSFNLLLYCLCDMGYYFFLFIDFLYTLAMTVTSEAIHFQTKSQSGEMTVLLLLYYTITV